MIFMGFKNDETIGIGAIRPPIKNEVVYRHEMDREPTMEDISRKLGLEEFVLKLQEEGWVAPNRTPLKDFDVWYGGCREPGNYYLEWKAVVEKIH